MAITRKDDDEMENENGLNEIAEMIDLRRGDILEVFSEKTIKIVQKVVLDIKPYKSQ
jgi:hypothetical protein